MMKNQLAGLMKQAQAMQDNMKKAQDQLALIEVEGQAGAGMVKVVMTCKNDVKRVTIDPSLFGDDKEINLRIESYNQSGTEMALPGGIENNYDTFPDLSAVLVQVGYSFKF